MKTLRVLLVFLLCFTQVTFVFASEDAETISLMNGGAREATEEDMSSALLEQENDPITQWALSGNMPEGRLTWYGLGVTYYGQETGKSCGPACVKMALKYLTGTTYPEATIRNNTSYNASSGTNLSNLVNYLNSEQDSRNYVKAYKVSEQSFSNFVYAGIVYASAPSICGLVEKYAYGFPYNSSSGHFVLIHQVAGDKSAVEVFDPWAGYVNEMENKTYELDMANIYSAYSLINCGLGY